MLLYCVDLLFLFLPPFAQFKSPRGKAARNTVIKRVSVSLCRFEHA